MEVPSVIGVEIQDDDTGDWSFIIMTYGFVWKDFPTYATHFSSGRQMASLIKALSESKRLHYPCLGNLQIQNVPRAFADEFGLSYSSGFFAAYHVPVVRLPVTTDHPHRSDQAVHWIGRGNFGSSTRA